MRPTSGPGPGLTEGRPPTSMRVLVVNAGSSSLKLRLLDGNDAVVAAEDLGPGPPDRQALERWTGSLGEIEAVGHRIVHGGTELVEPVRA